MKGIHFLWQRTSTSTFWLSTFFLYFAVKQSLVLLKHFLYSYSKAKQKNPNKVVDEGLSSKLVPLPGANQPNQQYDAR